MLSWILFFKLQNVNWISSREHAKEDSLPFSCLLPSPLSSFLLFFLSPDAYKCFPFDLSLFVCGREERPHFKEHNIYLWRKINASYSAFCGFPCQQLCFSPGLFRQNWCDLLYLHLVLPINGIAENQPLIMCKQDLCAWSPCTVQEAILESVAHSSDDLHADVIATHEGLGYASGRFPGGWTAHQLPKWNKGKMSDVGSDQPEIVFTFCERIFGNYVIFWVSHEA